VPTDLHDEIRDYARWLDATAPSLEKLTPSVAPARRRPTWGRAVLAAAVVLLLGVPLFGVLQDSFSGPDTADTITPSPIDGPVVLVREFGTEVAGKDFEPGDDVTVTVRPGTDADVTLPSTSVGQDGRFTVSLWPEYQLAPGEEVSVVVGAIGDPIVVAAMNITFDLLDPVADRAAGLAPVPDGTTVIVRIETGTDLAVAETESFNGAWEVDLIDVVDVTLDSVGSAWIASGDGFAASADRSAVPQARRIDLVTENSYLEGTGFTPGATAEIRLNGSALPAPVTVGPGGRISVFLNGFDIQSGDILEIDDGDAPKEIPIFDLMITSVDESTGRVAGVTDLPDGSEVVVEHRTAPGGTTTVREGTFEFTFDAGPLVDLGVGYEVNGGDRVSGTIADDGTLTTTTEAPTAAPRAPSQTSAPFGTPFDGPVVALDEDRRVMGWGFVPGNVVSLSIAPTVDGLDVPFPGFSDQALAEVASDGTFLAQLPIGFQGGDIVTVAVGDDLFVIPFDWLNLDLLDPETGVAAGVGPTGTEVTLRIDAGGDITTYTTTIEEDGWSIVGVPAIPVPTGTAWMGAGDGYVVTPVRTGVPREPRLEYSPHEPWLAAYGFDSNVAVTIRVNDIPVALEARTNIAGNLGLPAGPLGLEPGDVLDVSDGRTERSLTIHGATVTGVDGDRVRGTATLPDGALIQVNGQTARAHHDADAVVTEGSWEVRLPAAGPFDLFDLRFNEPDGDSIYWIVQP
jgi:hypothetical protein